MQLNEIVEKIKEHTRWSEEEIKKRIREKQAELYGLVSPEGAACVLARELGIALRETETVQINQLKENMNSISLKARVTGVFIRDFEKNGERKRVANIFLLDETGETRLVLWNEQIDRFLHFKEGDVIQIENGYVRKNIFGELEIRIGALGNVSVTGDDPSLPRGEGYYKESKIPMLEEGKRYTLRAAIVHVFNTNMVFEICPECGTLIKESLCPTHGSVTPEHTLIINTIIDDGYGNMRAVFFRDVAEKLVGSVSPNGEEMRERVKEILGREYLFYGKVKLNQVFGRKEFVVHDFSEINVKREAKMLIEELKNSSKV